MSARCGARRRGRQASRADGGGRNDTGALRFRKRVFWVGDNGTSHRREKATKRLAKSWPNLILVHMPSYASWLNQIEIYFLQ